MKMDKYEMFEMYLRNTNLSENTTISYTFAVRQYFTQFDVVNKRNLRAHKMWLVESYKPKTVNLRIRALNCYLDSIGKPEWTLQFVKVQQKAFLENVISEADYLYSKGGKLRRIYIPKALREEALAWLRERGQESGFLFLNRQGKKITTRGIAGQLKVLAKRYELDPAVVYPHSFRHRYAKSFLERFNDIALLADLMGHESIETTRIYLRRTSTEQQEIVDRIVNW